MTNRGVEWPVSARVVWREPLTLHAHNRGGSNSGGHYAHETAPGAVFEASVEVRPMTADDALDFRGFIHGLRGRGGNFFLQAGPLQRTPDPCGNSFGGKTHFTDCTQFTDGTRFADDYDNEAPLPGSATTALAAGSSSVPVLGDTGSSLFRAGAFMVVGDLEAGGQLVRVAAVSGGTATVVPKLRASHPAGTPILIGNVKGLFRLDQETPAVPLDGFRSGAVSIRLCEVY